MMDFFFKVEDVYLLDIKKKVFIFGRLNNDLVNMNVGDRIKYNNKEKIVNTIELVKIKNEEYLALGFNYEKLADVDDLLELGKGNELMYIVETISD